ncbi:MAG: hypothetical protein WCD86_10385 [Ktedonobacteraceae bacterium]
MTSQRAISRGSQTEQPCSLAARVIPPRTASRREMAALETTMANLALDDRHPVALELVGDATGVQFVIRATAEESLAHLIAQIRALYPQAEIVPLDQEDDPLRRDRHEAISMVELAHGAPSYLSLRTLDARSWERRESEGADPLLGILSALQALSAGTRAIAQLAMLPAKVQWSHAHLRKAVEHPLEPEREAARKRAGKSGSGPSMGAIIALAVVVALALIWRRFGRQLLPLIPSWMKQDFPRLLTGHLPSLTEPQMMQLVGGVVALFLAVFLISRVVLRLQGSRPLYDMRQVGEKTKRVAYRVRLRLIVIGPAMLEASPLPEGTGVRKQKIVQENVRAGKQRWRIPLLLALRRMEQKLWQWWRLMQNRHVQMASAVQDVWNWLSGVVRWIKKSSTWLVGQVQRWWRRQRAAHAASESRRQVTMRLTAAYRQYHQASGNYFVAKTLRFRHRHIVPRAFPLPSWQRVLLWLTLGRTRWEHDLAASPHYLSIEELASLWHLPPEQDVPDVPGLVHGRARTRLVPYELTGTQPDGADAPPVLDLVPYRLGTSIHAGRVWPVAIPQDVLHHNLLAVATTGKGKSTLFQHLALAHLIANRAEGLLFMEPHGDAIKTLLGCIPATRGEDVTLIDLADETAVVGLNPLDMTQGIDRDKTVENILAVFIAFWKKQRSWGPRTENILQFALLTLCEANLDRIIRDGELGVLGQYTLLDVIPLLQQQGYRHMVLEDVHDPVILAWWSGYFEPMRQSFRDEVISPVINKISKYAAARVSRRLLGQSRATVRLREDIAEGRIILINTASGIVGEELSALVGATLLGLFQSALAEQSGLARQQRRRFLVFIDEFQTYLGIDYPTMLAELRKYGGAFGLATQSLAYLDEMDRSLKATVLSNIDHLFAFTMSAEDARVIVPYLDGLEVADVLTLDDYTCYARLSHQGRRLPAFSLHLAPPPQGDAEQAVCVRHDSAARNARSASLVDADLARAPQQDRAFGTGDAKRVLALPDEGDEEGAAPKPRSSGRRGGGKSKGKSSASVLMPPTAPDGELLSRPYVLSPHQRPRSSVWHREDEERGEPGGE